MKTKISRLKKDISLLKEKLQQCREIIKDKEAERISFVQNNPSTIPLATSS
jgi:hypothetical protein